MATVDRIRQDIAKDVADQQTQQQALQREELDQN